MLFQNVPASWTWLNASPCVVFSIRTQVFESRTSKKFAIETMYNRKILFRIWLKQV